MVSLRSGKHANSEHISSSSTKISKPDLPICPLFTPPKHQTLESRDQTGLSPCPLFGPVEPTYFKIECLTLGNKPNTLIIGRVTNISEIRNWTNSNGIGRSFTFDIIDSSAEISVTVYNTKIDHVLGTIQINQVVEVRGFRVKPSVEKFRRISGQELELNLDNNGTVIESSQSCVEIDFNFLQIPVLNEKLPRSTADFLGIIYDVDKAISGTSNEGKDFSCRILHVTDESKKIFDVKIWGQTAAEFTFAQPTPIILRKVRIDEYQGQKSLNIAFNSLFWVNPEITKAKDMMTWFAAACVDQS